jgi:hypothetical protein
VARGTRRLDRAQEREVQGSSGKKAKADLKRPLTNKPGEMPDPFSGKNLKTLLVRLGIPVLAVWMVCGLVAAVSYSTTLRIVMIAIPSAITLAAVGLVLWGARQARRARGVASILRNVESQEDRKAAISELESTYKKNDPAAVFAKAQLELQEDPKKALETLEQIDLNKVMAPVADEARTQRAMIHLLLGDVSPARQLVDNIDLKRHQEAKSRAMMAAIIAEAWARSGQAKKAIETLEVFNPDDPEYEQLRPQIYRAYAFAYAHLTDLKGVKRSLRKLLEQDVRLLGSFMQKKTHPLLQKEAKKMAEQSGQMPRKMVVQRRP